MDCLHRCFGKTDEPDENLYSSLQEVIKGLKNIKDKQPESAEGMKNFITNMAQKYDRQIKDIENMKKIINTIINEITLDEKKIAEGLKYINKDDAFGEVVTTVTDNLLTAIKELKKSKETEKQLINDLNSTFNSINVLEAKIAKQRKQANILAQSYAAGVTAPDIKYIDENSGTNKNLIDIFGNHTTVHFLSKDGTLLQGEQFIKSYDPKNFDCSQFYYLGEDGKYQILNNLEDIECLDTSRIILAYQKKN